MKTVSSTGLDNVFLLRSAAVLLWCTVNREDTMYVVRGSSVI